MSTDEPQRVYFFVDWARTGAESRFAVPVYVMERWQTGSRVRGLAGRWRGRTFAVPSNHLYTYVPSDARLVAGGRAFLPVECPELKSARALRKRLGRTMEYGDATDADRAFRSIDRLAKRVRVRNPNDLSWRLYPKDRAHWFDSLDRLQSRNEVTRAGHLAVLFAMLDLVIGAAERSAPCTGHSDCREFPELGAACTAAGTARRPA